jgi:Fic-DOC domain mobile mystery protein B
VADPPTLGGPGGQTELDEDDRFGLLHPHVATRDDLFVLEQENIAMALDRPQPTVEVLLDDKYLRDLHSAMFGEVWEWAGRYRLRETNIGVDPATISTAVRTLVADVRTWVDHQTYDPDEVAVRFHHRLVSIHPFPNGNGRHGRVAADYLVTALGGRRFGWGIGLEVSTADLRAAYRQGLERADAGDIGELLVFARS